MPPHKKAVADLQDPEFLAQVIAELVHRQQTAESQIEVLMAGFVSMQNQIKQQEKLIRALETLIDGR